MLPLLVIVSVVFLFGLVQWARGGAGLWDIHRLLRHGPPPNAAGTKETDQDAGESLQKSIQSMERMTDGLLRSSFKVMGILALGVWIFVVITVIVDMLGLDWLDRASSYSSNRVVGNPQARSTQRRSGFGGAVNNRGSDSRTTRPSTAENARSFRW
jgi:hypothetical protein